MSRLPSLIQPLMRNLLAPLRSDEPVDRLIRSTARQQWRLIVLNLSSSLVEAFTEGATLAVMFIVSCASGYKVGDLTDYASNGPEAICLRSSRWVLACRWRS